MASNPDIPCGPCAYERNTNVAMKWCSHCEEGFCTDCEKSHRSLKLTRDHKVIAIEDYLKIQDVSVDLTCKTHGKKLDLFCKFHGVAICAVCVPSAHKTCQAYDIISIDDAAENAKSSAALTELEVTISRTLEHVRPCIKNRLSASMKIDTDDQMIKEFIKETRMKLNKQLDALEKKLLLELKLQHEKCKAKHSKLLKKLEQTEKEFEKLEEQTQQMKLFASDLQVFLGTCQMNKITMEKIALLKAEIGKERNYAIQMKLNSVVSSLINEVKEFGEIHITETKADLQFKDPMISQAQIKVREAMRNIDGINLQLKLEFDIQEHITGCLILSDGRIFIASCWTTGELMEYDEIGNYVRTVQTPSNPYDLTEIDTDRIAVTYPKVSRIEILNIKENTVETKIECKGRCYGISQHSGKIFTIVKELGILMMDLNGTILETFAVDISSVFHLTATEDKFYYTVPGVHTVKCCYFEGKEIRVFKNRSLKYPGGITVDSNQNVYVSGGRSHNIILIQHDEHQSKVVLSKLSTPGAICYNKTNNLILLSYNIGFISDRVALYQVSSGHILKH
ncbi:Hypothetical predicted protein [Mytilus galloprovincialis]|uniref:B box-type domain-containing protein n=1 Tax=Mytilus galloprovincialis TaxID=29158 RepID=A0A8B6GEJ5_MYTGA|nr:Hypothetical predicted protein [Mytilus galloprovincialis]